MRREPKAASVLDFTPPESEADARAGRGRSRRLRLRLPLCLGEGVIHSKEVRGQARARADSEPMTKLRFIRLLLLAAMIAAAFAKGHPIGMSDGGYW
jgi:hypothetical protein